MRFLQKSTSLAASVAVMAVIGFSACAAEKLYPLSIHTREGAKLIQVELANTVESRAKGLMGRTSLASDHGMLFVFPVTQNVSFWMHNTLIPLDLVYITDKGVVNHIHPMAKPLDESPLPSAGGPIKAVLEIAGGQAAQKGIMIGDTIETPLLEGTAE